MLRIAIVAGLLAQQRFGNGAGLLEPLEGVVGLLQGQMYFGGCAVAEGLVAAIPAFLGTLLDYFVPNEPCAPEGVERLVEPSHLVKQTADVQIIRGLEVWQV